MFYLIGYLKNPSRILDFVKLMHLIQLPSDAQIFLGPCANMSCNKTTETEHVPHILELYFIRDYLLEEDWTIALYNIRHEVIEVIGPCLCSCLPWVSSRLEPSGSVGWLPSCAAVSGSGLLISSRASPASGHLAPYLLVTSSGNLKNNATLNF